MRGFIGFAIFAAALAAASPARTDGALTPDQERAVKTLVRDYLLTHPEIVGAAIEALRKRREDAKRDDELATLAAHRSELLHDRDSPVGGNLRGDVTVVEFFDYGCGVCKRVHPIMARLMEGDRGIRRVYKEWPILGPESVFAARAALASRAQGRYLAFHDALMEARGRLDRDAVLTIAGRVGLDRERLVRDMEEPETMDAIRRNYRLAEALELDGTPSFVIGDVVLRGGRDLETMRRLVAAARARRR